MRPITEPPPRASEARFRPGFGQRFILTVDTGEMRDGSAPGGRAGHGLAHLPRLAKFQQFCEDEGVAPVYLVDYAVATSALAADVLREPVNAGRAEIGMELAAEPGPGAGEAGQSRASALPAAPESERTAFNRVRLEIERNFGALPLIYRAAGNASAAPASDVLRESGIAMDSSVRPKFDYRAQGGPDFRRHTLRPYWLNSEGSLLELPLTTVYWGMLRKQGDLLYPIAQRSRVLGGFLARAGLLSRISLNPAAAQVEEAIQGIDIALDDGLPLLVFSFDASSLIGGGQRAEGEYDAADRLYDWWQRVFAYLAIRGVQPTGVREIMAGVEV